MVVYWLARRAGRLRLLPVPNFAGVLTCVRYAARVAPRLGWGNSRNTYRSVFPGLSEGRGKAIGQTIHPRQPSRVRVSAISHSLAPSGPHRGWLSAEQGREAARPCTPRLLFLKRVGRKGRHARSGQIPSEAHFVGGGHNPRTTAVGWVFLCLMGVTTCALVSAAKTGGRRGFVNARYRRGAGRVA